MQYTSREVYEYISQQTNDAIVEWKKCVISGQDFPIYQSDLEFYDKISPSFTGQKFAIPTPTLCPEERQRRRLSFRNERKLYRRKCDATGKDIISIYSPNKPYKVYNQNFWWSDNRDPMEYGFEFDFGRSFVEQYSNFTLNIPWLSLMNMENQNSEYTNYTGFSKSCYMCSDVLNSDILLYSNIIKSCNDCMELSYSKNCKKCYEIQHAENCHNCSFSQFIENCDNCHYSNNLIGCKNCLFCTGINNAEYYIYNEKVTPEEFKTTFVSIMNDPLSYIKKFQELQHQNKINQSIVNIGSTNVIGNMTNNSLNCVLYFDSYNNNGCRYGFNGDSNISCLDVSVCNPNCQFSYNTISGGEQTNCAFNVACGYGSSIYYSTLCFYSSNLFGCIGLRNKQYCIFNKQYSKEEYEIMVAKIINHMIATGEWGEFFDPSLSPFGYNETVANEYYPVQVIANEMKQSIVDCHVADATRNDDGINLAKFGYKWSDYSSDPKVPDGVKTYCKSDHSDESWHELVNDDNIVKYIIICEVSGRPFMIQKMELEFYRKHSLGIPSKHPDIRHEERMRLRPGRTLYLRKCDCCGEEMLSVYDKDYESKVYCEKCYQKEVYG